MEFQHRKFLIRNTLPPLGEAKQGRRKLELATRVRVQLACTEALGLTESKTERIGIDWELGLAVFAYFPYGLDWDGHFFDYAWAPAFFDFYFFFFGFFLEGAYAT